MRRLTASLAVLGALVLVVTTLGVRQDARAAGEPLRYLGGQIGTLDPAFISDAADVQLLLQLYAGLTRLDEEGTVYPSLADSWTVSDDGLTYTFTLREGLTFSDGSELRAADIRRSWLRLLDPAVGAFAPGMLTVVRGASARLAGGAEDGVGITAPDARTLVVELEHAAGYFTSITATPATFVVPPAAGTDDTWQTAERFVGSGPYVVERMEGDDVVLRASDRYVGGAPPIDEVRWVGRLDDDVATAFADGRIDLTGIASSDASWISYDRDLGPSLQRGAALSVQYFAFDTTRPPFDDARVRRAFALALDRTRLVELSAGTDARPAGSVVPPALWPGDTFGEPDPADLDAARALLAEAGYASGSALGTITVNGTGLDVSPAVAIWEAALGVTIDIEVMDFNDYVGVLRTDPPQVYTINWIADYPSPHALYGLLLQPDAPDNNGRWVDEGFAELLQAAAEQEEPAAQAAAYRAVDARVREEAPLVPWSYDENWWLVRDGLRGTGQLTIGLLDFGRLSWDG
ncbi:MAG: peptide ABC transporter substrate-binding protein [Chloroflexota bacterium]